MKRAVLVIFSLAVFCMSAAADSRNAKIKDLMRAQGLVQTFEQQLATGRVQAREQSTAMLEQLLKGINPPPKFQQKLQEASTKFMEALQPSWTATEIVDVWAQYYGQAFTDAELDSLLAFYKSPLAQREIVVGRQAMDKLSEHFMAKYKPVMDAATTAYVRDLQTIARECNCRR